MHIEKYELTNKNKYNVYLSNGEVITLDERVITENELLLKKEIDKELYDKVTKESRVFDLVDMAVKYISVRLRSIKEMKDYLKKKETDEKLINLAIDKLIRSGYLDDDKFTKAYIKDKLNFTNKGDYKIKMELQNLGVSSEIIEANISMIDDDLLKEKIKKQIEKDIRINKKYSGATLKNKIYNHLVTSGYTKETVISVLNNYNF